MVLGESVRLISLIRCAVGMVLPALMLGLAVSAGAQTEPEPLKPTPHEYIIKNFKTESGVVLPEAKIVYGTYGTLNAAGDNAILLPSHYMAKMNGYGFVIGPGNALDPARFFMVTSELFGNGRSSSPSNTPEPFHGPRFPVMTIRDNVNAVHQMLTEQLYVKHLKAVIGFSMGAQQAFQWAVSYPEYMDYIVATSGTAKTYGHGIVRNASLINAIETDCTFDKGDYKAEPTKGIEAFNLIWTAWLFSQEWWHEELWKTDSKPGTTLEQVVENFKTHFIPGADANDLILQLRTWDANDVGATPGFGGDVKKALGSIKAPVLYMPSATDLYFPVTDAKFEAQFIRRVTLLPIPSLWGHPAGAGAGPGDKKFINDHIASFLRLSSSGSARP
jgi:homoserine O-acetyltransferase